MAGASQVRFFASPSTDLLAGLVFTSIPGNIVGTFRSIVCAACRIGLPRVRSSPHCFSTRAKVQAASWELAFDPSSTLALEFHFFNHTIGYIKDKTASFPMAPLPIVVVATSGTIGIFVIGRHQPRTVAV